MSALCQGSCKPATRVKQSPLNLVATMCGAWGFSFTRKNQRSSGLAGKQKSSQPPPSDMTWDSAHGRKRARGGRGGPGGCRKKYPSFFEVAVPKVALLRP